VILRCEALFVPYFSTSSINPPPFKTTPLTDSQLIYRIPQGVEWYGGAPIIYGLGDFLFRHFPGITDYCPAYAVPCEQFHPELAVMHVLNLEAKNKTGNDIHGGFRVAKIITHPTRHTTEQVFFADSIEDKDWVFHTLTELNKQLGSTAKVINGTDGTLTILPSNADTTGHKKSGKFTAQDADRCGSRCNDHWDCGTSSPCTVCYDNCVDPAVCVNTTEAVPIQCVKPTEAAIIQV